MADGGFQFGRIGHTGCEPIGPSVQGTVDRGSHGPLAGIEVDVARADRQAIGLPDGWHCHDPDGEGEVANQLAHQDHLLEVLLPEIGALGSGQVEDTVRTPAKWPGRLFPSSTSASGPGSMRVLKAAG